ncbi:MAG: hypothetical protein AB7O96_11790 [Pseudobdellovibrionaceae bacterium]
MKPVLLLLGFLTSLAFASSPLELSVEQCQRSGILKLNDGLSIDQIDEAIERAKFQKEADCDQALTDVNELEKASTELKYSSEAVGTALEKAISRGDSAVNSKLAEYDQQLQLLKKMNPPSRLEIQNLESSYLLKGKEVTNLEISWDQLFRPEAGGPVERLAKLSYSPLLPQEVRVGVEEYLNSVPPYLLGKGSAPREKIDFLKRQEKLVGQVLVVAQRAYHQTHVEEANRNIEKSLSAELANSIAASARMQLLRKFSYKIAHCGSSNLSTGNCSPWAVEARKSGACRMAEEVVKYQLNAFQSAIDTATPGLKASLAATFSTEIEARKQFLTETSCSQSPDERSIIKSLVQLQRTLPLFCDRKSSDIAERAQGLLVDIEVLLSLVDKLQGEQRKAIYNLAQELWTQGYFLKQTCQKAVR